MKHRDALRILWDALEAENAESYLVFDEHGGNIAAARVINIDNNHWLYVDDVDGFSIIDTDTFNRLAIGK